MKLLKNIYDKLSLFWIVIAIMTAFIVLASWFMYTQSSNEKFDSVYGSTHYSGLVEFVDNNTKIEQKFRPRGSFDSIYLKLATYSNSQLECDLIAKLYLNYEIVSETRIDCSNIIDNGFNLLKFDKLIAAEAEELVLSITSTGSSSNPIAIYVSDNSENGELVVDNEIRSDNLAMVAGSDFLQKPSILPWIIVTFILIVLKSSVFLFRRSLLKINWNWLIIVLAVGIFYIFLVPPFNYADEHEHFLRAVEISQYDFSSGKYNGFITNSKVVEAVNSTLWGDDYLNGGTLNELIGSLKLSINSGKGSLVKSQTMAAGYFPLSHLLWAIPLAFLRYIGMPMLISMYLLRLVSLTVFVFFVILAIKIKPDYKLYWIALAILPSVISQASAISLDGIVAGAIMVTVALILDNSINKKRLSKRFFLLIITPILLFLAFSKYIYLPIALLPILFYQSTKLKSSELFHRFSIAFVFTLVVIGISVAWMKYNKGFSTSDPRFPGSNPELQMEYAISHPFETTAIITNSIISRSAYIITESIGGIRTNYRRPHLEFLLIAHSVLLIILMYSLSGKVDRDTTKLVFLLSILSFFFVIAALVFVLFLGATNYGSRDVFFPPRYFTTLIPMLLLFFKIKDVPVSINKNLAGTLLISILIITILSMYYQAIAFIPIWI